MAVYVGPVAVAAATRRRRPRRRTSTAGATTTSSTVPLTWSASTDNVGVTGYQVFRNGTLVATVDRHVLHRHRR